MKIRHVSRKTAIFILSSSGSFFVRQRMLPLLSLPINGRTRLITIGCSHGVFWHAPHLFSPSLCIFRFRSVLLAYTIPLHVFAICIDYILYKMHSIAFDNRPCLKDAYSVTRIKLEDLIRYSSAGPCLSGGISYMSTNRTRKRNKVTEFK